MITRERNGTMGIKGLKCSHQKVCILEQTYINIITLYNFIEFEKQRLGAIRPLAEMVVVKGFKTGLHDNEDQWKDMCETRFGLTVSRIIPYY